MAWQLHLQADDELRRGLQAYAKARRLSVSAAVRLILTEAIKNDQES
jgi:hypothetical protein